MTFSVGKVFLIISFFQRNTLESIIGYFKKCLVRALQRSDTEYKITFWIVAHEYILWYLFCYQYSALHVKEVDMNICDVKCKNLSISKPLATS